MAPRKPIRNTVLERTSAKSPRETASAATKSSNKTSSFQSAKAFFADERTRFIIGLFLVITVIYVFFSLFSYFFTGAADQSKLNVGWAELKEMRSEIQNWTSVTGAIIAETAINQWFGVSVFFILAFFTVVAFRLMRVKIYPLWKAFLQCAFWTIWLSVFLGFTTSSLLGDKLFFALGGQHGNKVSAWVVSYVGILGTALIITTLLILYCVIASKKTIPFIKNLFTRKNKEKSETTAVYELENEDREPSVAVGTEIVDEDWISSGNNDDDDEQNLGFEIITEQEDNIGFETEKTDSQPFAPNTDDVGFEITPNSSSASAEADENGETTNYNLEKLGKYDPTLDLSHYHFPTPNLLKIYDSDSGTAIDIEEQKDNKNRIIKTLQNYGVEIDKIQATVGPTITLYEIVPKAGVRISKIRNLESDIMLSLAATGIRIIAPIPGKGTIGIEVPNNSPQVVSMHSVIVSKKFQESTFELPVVFGKTITNEAFMVDLTKMPHLLVAGATGQGKSVGLNAIITSLLYKKHPAELKLVLVDPKKVEFNIYADIDKHFLAKMPDGEDAIITDTSKVVQTLNSLCMEMDDRYDLLKKAHTRNIREYNEKFINRQLNPEKGHRFLPYIVVIVDEFGDLIMTAGKEVEMPIARIAQLARAVGIHMIIATQRPSVNIITGIIKANFPARVAFKVSSMMDSRTILDAPGANQLVGRGDMLFSQGNDLTRVQCAFVDTPEVEKIVNHIYKEQGYPTAFYLPEYVGGEGGESVNAEAVDMNRRDPLFDDAARLIVASQQGSTSLIQRKFSIGYNRAGRLADQLEVAGIIGATQGSKPRDVLVQTEYDLERILKNLP
ncbi:MAG: DNA translocase FtsK [Paludibacter sp.]|jgi:S-DNA-T family DNA segregation ATPase FtsK/SpoIIIE|nr:DNA translocase FtsK [Paludibacter sp.]